MKESMKIISLEAQNVLKLKVVRIKPDGSTIVIGGKNAQGKSSILNCIMAALGGKSHVPGKAVRDGEKKGFVELDLGKYKVKRTFTEAGGGTVTVETPEGASFKSPQQMLDGLLGTISFDPLAFAKYGSQGSAGIAKQVEILKQISGVDTSKLDREHIEVYDSRADINREVKRLEGVLSELTFHDDAPAEPVSVSELAEELERVNTENNDIIGKRGVLQKRSEQKDGFEEEIKILKRQLAEKEEELEVVENWIDTYGPDIEKLEQVDPDPIREKIAGAEETNQKVLDNASFKSTTDDLEEQKIQSESAGERLDSIKDKKRKLIESSDLPIKDLIFDDSGITFQGIPFDQASDAEKLRVSVALGLAMNPELKVLLVRGGSDLDEDNLAMVSKMAEDADGQLWIERVGTGEEMTIIMEDGEIKK